MRRKQFLLGAMVLLVSLLMVSCGIPQEVYDVVLAERNAAQDKVESLQTQVGSLQTEVESLEDELDEAQEQLESIENERSELVRDLATAQSQISSLQSDLDDAISNLDAAEEKIARMESIYNVVLFFDDFEDGDVMGWNLEGAWTVIQEDGNYLLQGVGPGSAEAGLQEWADYTLEARIKFSQSVDLNFRITTESGMYLLDILPEGPILYKKLLDLDEVFLAQSGLSPKENQWIELKVEVEGNGLEIYMDGALLFRYTDSTPLLSGNFSFELPEDSVLYLDDVIVMVVR